MDSRERASRGESSSDGAAAPADENRLPQDSEPSGPEFTCHICLDTANNPVVSRCGHLFCWPCLHRWMGTERGNVCPVCKAGISEENVTPIYLGGKSADRDDPRKQTPPRPTGERPAPEPPQGGQGGLWGGTNGFHFSLGVGAFPFFGLYSTQFGGGGHNHQAQGNPVRNDQEATAARMFLFFGILAVLWLLL